MSVAIYHKYMFSLYEIDKYRAWSDYFMVFEIRSLAVADLGFWKWRAIFYASRI